MLRIVLPIAIFILIAVAGASGQTTEIAYQGLLQNGGVAANGSYDLELRLFDSLAGGLQVGPLITRTNVAVTNGIFTVYADVGAVFPGPDRFLEIQVRTAGGGAYTLLSPRQRVNSAPYSIKSLSTETANNSLQLNGVPGNQYVVTTDPRMTDARTPTAGSTSYIQNTLTPQTASNFNVSGNGTVGGTLTGNIVNATQQLNLNNTRAVAITGNTNFPLSNTFVGSETGAANVPNPSSSAGHFNAFFGGMAGRFNTTGQRNSFFGARSGTQNTSGFLNSFFGDQSGAANTTGDSNTFIGTISGFFNTTASYNTFVGANSGVNNNASGNSFFGSFAGESNTTAFRNAFFGSEAGRINQTGSDNSFFGHSSGRLNVSGSFNSFFGTEAGRNNTASGNSFFGRSAGFDNTTGANNGFFGFDAGRFNTIGSDNAFFGTAAGKSNTIGADNSFLGTAAGLNNVDGSSNSFFGRSAGRVNISGSSNAFFGVDAGRNNTASSNSFFGFESGIANTTGSNNTFFGRSAGQVNTTSGSNAFFGTSSGNASTGNENTFIGFGAGVTNTSGDRNTFVGKTSGTSNTSGNDNTAIGNDTVFASGGLSFATAIGSGAEASVSNSIYLGRPAGEDTVRAPGNLNVTGSTTLNGNVVVASGATVVISSPVSITSLGAAGATDLCRNASNQIATCSSSLRYKTNIHRFSLGLDLVKRLRPITFDWKDGGIHDLGLGAEDVAEIEPLLVTYNGQGQVEGVKYDRIGVVLLNAIKEQQTQIELLKTQIKELQEQNRQQGLFNDRVRTGN